MRPRPVALSVRIDAMMVVSEAGDAAAHGSLGLGTSLAKPLWVRVLRGATAERGNVATTAPALTALVKRLSTEDELLVLTEEVTELERQILREARDIDAIRRCATVRCASPPAALPPSAPSRNGGTATRRTTSTAPRGPAPTWPQRPPAPTSSATEEQAQAEYEPENENEHEHEHELHAESAPCGELSRLRADAAARGAEHLARVASATSSTARGARPRRHAWLDAPVPVPVLDHARIRRGQGAHERVPGADSSSASASTRGRGGAALWFPQSSRPRHPRDCPAASPATRRHQPGVEFLR